MLCIVVMPKPTACFIKEQVNTDMRFQRGKPKAQPVSAAFLSALVQSLAQPRWALAAGCTQGRAAPLRTPALLPALPQSREGTQLESPFLSKVCDVKPSVGTGLWHLTEITSVSAPEHITHCW